MKRTVATVGLVCALMIGCMGMPPVRAAESDTDKVTTDIGTKVMPFEELSVEVVDSIHEDLMQHEDGKEWALSRIGICEKPDPKFCDPFEYNEIMENENVLVRYQLRANYQARRGEKTGFWDIILVHQKPIPQVPKDMRP